MLDFDTLVASSTKWFLGLEFLGAGGNYLNTKYFKVILLVQLGLCIQVNLINFFVSLFSYTELEIAVPDIGFVGLHAENLGIESVLVDGEPTEFEYYPHHQNPENENRWSSVSSPSDAADAAGVAYISSLERELVPNLLINCCKPFKGLTEQLDQITLEDGLQSSSEIKQVTDSYSKINN